MLKCEEKDKASDLLLFLDRPETSDLKFGYRVTVDWLKDILVNSPKPFRLAITGALGAGKSTLIRNALDELESDATAEVVTAYVDVWKLDKESARRSAVLQIAKRLKLSDETIKSFERDIYGVVTGVNDESDNKSLADKNKPIKKIILTAIPFAVVLSIIIYVVLGEILESDKPSESIKIFLSLLTAFATATYTIISNLFVNMFVNIKNTVSRAPLVGPEEFEKCLRLILNDSSIVNKTVVIVFDNIDRAPVERTQEILTGLSAFFDDSEEFSERNLIIVVPFAKGAAQGLNDKTIQKFFDVVVPLPEIISQDLTEYAEDMISKSIWNRHKKEIAELITLGPHKTPRGIIHCVNELFSLLHLAQQMENKSLSSNGSATEEYLSPGMVTENVLVYAKIVVCQSIWEDFLKNGVLNFWSIEEMFTPEKYDDVLPEPQRWEEKEKVQELKAYLNSTIGLPQNVPYSPEPFFHLKGADELLKIQGGPEIERAFSLRDVKTVEKYLDSEDQQERVANLRTIFDFCIRKYKNSNQRRKNTVVSFLNALFAKKISDESSAKVIADQILKNPDLINEVGVGQIAFIAPQNEKGTVNDPLWKLMDEEYLRKQNNKEIKEEKDEEWSIQYLAQVLLQPTGMDRAKITKKDFNLRRLNSDKIISAIGELYPANFSSPETALEAISTYTNQQFLISTIDEMVRVESIIKSGLASANTEVQGPLVSALNSTWSFFGNNLSKSDFSEQSFIGAAFILGGMPSDVRCSSATWQQQLITNLNSRYADFQRLVPTCKAGILLFLISIGEKHPIQNFSELFSVFRSAVASMNDSDLKKLVDYSFGWNWFPKIWGLAQGEFRNRLINDPGILDFVLMNCDSTVAEVLKSEWANLKSNPSFGLVLKKPNTDQGVVRRDWIEIISKNPSHFSETIRRSCMEAASLEDPKMRVEGLIDHELDVLKDLPTTTYLLEWLSENDTAKLEQVVEKRDEYLRKATPEIWGPKEICSLKIVTENLHRLQNDPCEQIIDKAIQRGVKDGESTDISVKTSEMVLKILECGKGLDFVDAVEESFKKTGKLSDEQKALFVEKIESIRDNFDLQKKGIFDKLNPFKKED